VSLAALIVAAGRGSRALEGAGPAIPKQYACLAGRPLLAHTLDRFLDHPAVAFVQVVIHPDDRSLYEAAVAHARSKLLAPVAGGATRQASVKAGLEALAAYAPELVLIHDAARPFVSGALITAIAEALRAEPGAIAAEPLADTLKRQSPDGLVSGTVERSGLWRAQTPQGFRFADILAAHRDATLRGHAGFTDDAAAAEWAGLSVALVPGGSGNFKITTLEDLAMAERLLSSAHETRIGSGFDVHRFAPGDHVWLCGVKIPHTHRLEGHSDADAPLHALTDAILGALGDGDIGVHFPPEDPQWRGAPSRLFLEDAAKRVQRRGGRIVHVDVTILCEAPRIGPHREAMRTKIAEILGLSADRVGLKATTTEGLGFTGRGEGLAAMASVTLLLPCA
jgi:2-C-methyl-D-erythritol 4-phosphate cytidylyltransferase/2-C-methyl-D-erythritol 2,4-cyclodiphosphate synthase